jgi:hypothetical protein
MLRVIPVLRVHAFGSRKRQELFVAWRSRWVVWERLVEVILKVDRGHDEDGLLRVNTWQGFSQYTQYSLQRLVSSAKKQNFIFVTSIFTKAHRAWPMV